MSGIAGLLGWSADEATLRRMLWALRHRGPAGETVLVVSMPGGGQVTLGERHASAPWPAPPSESAESDLILVLDGDLFNRAEIVAHLEALGHRLTDPSDRGAVLGAYVQWGPDCLTRLQGAFAFALLDRAAGRLLLARDAFGIRPLYYAPRPGGLAFASEIPALFEVSGVTRAANLERLYRYLLEGRTDQGEATLFADVRQLPPGHALEVTLENATLMGPARYWPTGRAGGSPPPLDEAAARVRAIFVDELRRQLPPTGRTAVTVSGGLDSSMLLMAAREALGGPDALEGFSYLTDDPDLSEASFAEAASRRASVPLRRLFLAPEDLRQAFDGLHRIQAEPFGSPTIYAQHRLFGLAREAGAEVVMGGQGADRLFGGYHLHTPERLASLLRSGRWAEALRLLRGASVVMSPVRLTVAGAAALLPAPAGRLARRLLHRAPFLPWVDTRWWEERGVADPPEGNQPGVNPVSRHHRFLEASLPAALRFEDRSAAAHGLVNRVPFLTVPLAELAFSLEEGHFITPDGVRKRVLRLAACGLVPDPVLDRRDKIGFATPVADWLLALRPWVEARLRRTAALPGIRGRGLAEPWARVLSSRDSQSAYLVWRLLSLATWAEQFQVEFR